MNGDPGALHVLHRCDNPLCCNPDHLFLGTNQDNILDKVAKSRQARGESGGMTRYTTDQVTALRQRVASGELAASVAKELGITQSAASRIVTRDTWRHLP